jgi:hypothetical protein
MRVKGFVSLLTALLITSVLPQVAHAADLPSFEIKSVSSTMIDPGDTITWKIKVNLIPGWLKGLNLNLIDPSGQVRQLYTLVESVPEVKEKKSVEVALSLKTNDYDLAGKYRLQFAYLANVSEVIYYDPINGKDYATKNENTFAQNMSQFDFTIRDAGAGKQKTPQAISSVVFAKKTIDPGAPQTLDFVTSGSGTLTNVYVRISTPDGYIDASCDASNPNSSNACKNFSVVGNSNRFSFPIWTAIDNSPGLYKVERIILYYRNGDPNASGNDTATWGGNLSYGSDPSDFQQLSKFPPENLTFTLLDAGQGVAKTPIWTEIAWKDKSVKAGSVATLVIAVDGFNRVIGNIAIPLLTALNGKDGYVYTNQNGTDQVVRQVKPLAGNSILPATKSGTFEVEIYIPRNTFPGSYVIGQLNILGTACQFKNVKDIYSYNLSNGQICQGWPNGWHTSYYLGSLNHDFGTSGSAIKPWVGYISPMTIPLEVTAAAPLVAPKLELVEVTPSSVEWRFQSSNEYSCKATSDVGDVVEAQLISPGYFNIKINNLKPSTAATLKLSCADLAGANASTSATERSTKPIPPASPKVTLDSVTTNSAQLSFNLRDGFKYTASSDSGSLVIIGSNVLVSNLAAGKKVSIVITITDGYGQSTTAEPFYFSSELPKKPLKPTLTPGRVTTNRVEFKYEKLPDLDYELTVSEGEVSDIRGSVTVSGLTPNTKIVVSLKVTDEFGQSTTSDDLLLKSAIPELPAMPILYLSKTTSDSLSLRFTPRAGMKYALKVSAGSPLISDGSIVISGLKPLQKVEVSLVMIDAYGQYKNSDFYTFTTAAAPKAADKTSITCVKGKTSKLITAVKPTCPSGYTKK